MTANCRSRNIASLLVVVMAAPAFAQVPKPVPPVAPPAQATTAKPAPPVAAGPDVVVPPGYVIGTEDMLTIVYWKDKDMTTDTQVRPDGRIALPLLNDVHAAGLTPEQLREKLTEESKKFMEDPNITVVVRQINSRKAYITGEVNRPGPYMLTSPTTVLQLISIAGGLREYANSKKIVIMRTENGKQISLMFNYRDVIAGKNLKQNVELKPGDTVVVP